MSYNIIYPLGPRRGYGSYETFYDAGKYKSHEEAAANNDYVVVNFVEDERGIKHLEAYHSRTPQEKIYWKMYIQHFPFGIDKRDDVSAENMAQDLYLRDK